MTDRPKEHALTPEQEANIRAALFIEVGRAVGMDPTYVDEIPAHPLVLAAHAFADSLARLRERLEVAEEGWTATSAALLAEKDVRADREIALADVCAREGTLADEVVRLTDALAELAPVVRAALELRRHLPITTKLASVNASLYLITEAVDALSPGARAAVEGEKKEEETT